MSFQQPRSETESRNPIPTELADGRRRHVLTILADRSSPASEAELAIRIAATELEKSLTDVAGEEMRSARIDLSHVQLPKLEDAGLIERDEEAGTVATTNHPLLTDPTFERILETEADGWDEVVAALADETRRITLSVLGGRNEPIEADALARQIAAGETAERDALAPETVEELGISLRHVHLPKLEEAGLIKYDPTVGTIEYAGHSALDDELLEFRGNESV